MDDLIIRRAAIEAIKELESSEDFSFNNALICAMNNIAELTPAQRWIPCNEKLPSVKGAYLVSGGLEVWICMFTIINISESKHIGGWSNYVDRPVVKAWMPLPEPYKEEP